MSNKVPPHSNISQLWSVWLTMTHLNFKWFSWNAEWFVCACVLGSVLDHDHLHSSSFLHCYGNKNTNGKQRIPNVLCCQVNTNSLLAFILVFGWTLTWRLLMVSPPFPMTRPALEAGTIISWTVMPGPSLWWNAGAGRPFSTISVSSLFAALMGEKWLLYCSRRSFCWKVNFRITGIQVQVSVIFLCLS